MPDLGSLAGRLGDAADAPSAAELLAEHALEIVGDGAVRVYLLGPGDRCSTCARAADCRTRDRCLHLEASLGSFAHPPGHVERVPRTDAGWREALEGSSEAAPGTVPPPLLAPDGEEEDAVARLVPLVAGGAVLGVAGLRCPAAPTPEVDAEVRTTACMAAATFRHLTGVEREIEQGRRLLLVNDLGRKVTSILDDELLLRQAADGIHRTFGFHNVMIFMRDREQDEGATRLRLRAQASTYTVPSRVEGSVDVAEGIVGRVFRNRQTEIVRDVSQDADFVQWFPDTKSEIAVPILIDGAVEGVLNVESDRVDSFGDAERLVLDTVANQLAIAIENAQLFGMVKEREDRYRVLVESNPGAVIHLDSHGGVVFVNPAFEALTGRPARHLVAGGTLLSSLAHEESRQTLEEATEDALRGKARRDVEFQIEHADGGLRFVQASFQPLVAEGHDPSGVVVLARDQTREKELQERLYQSEKLSAIGGLVSGVAHELNNPLAGILGFAQLLLSRAPEEWSRKDVEQIEKNAKRCQRIVDDLLAFARQARLSRRLANLNEVIDSVLRLNEYQFHVDDIEVQRDYDQRIPPLYLDVNRWQQVFVNLATNAHQALHASESETRVIRFETRRREEEVVIRVSDTGPGVAFEDRPRVFEPFFTTKDDGTGLGLGICYGIVAEHGGRIELETGAEQGTCFRITLPLEARPAVPKVVELREIPKESESGVGRRVLVVDDQSSVRDVVARALANHRYAVDTASDGATAIERVAENDYDVILTDVSMPGPFKGIGLYDRLIEERPQLGSRIVFLSGYLHDDVLMSQIEARGGRFVEKPFDIHELARIVADVAAGADGGGVAGADGGGVAE